VVAGDISPIDVISHVPVICEDNSVPYIFVPSKEVPARPLRRHVGDPAPVHARLCTPRHCARSKARRARRRWALLR
jgi:hypothetical protein